MNEKLIIPGSIIIAGLIIGLAVYMTNNQSSAIADVPTPETPQETNIKKVDPASDHIDGNPAADLFVVEYSDLECPFCKQYHDESLSRLKEDYADDERVAFVFRHFPLDTPYTQQALHPTAQEEHIAAECVAKLNGDEAFFVFTDSVFATDVASDLSVLSDLAEQAGVNRTAFDTCYQNQDTESLVRADFEEGLVGGVQGTPTVFIQTKGGKTFRAEADYSVVKTSLAAYLSDLQ